LLPTANIAILSAMCGSQVVQWPASHLPPPASRRTAAQDQEHSTAHLLVHEWHIYCRVQQHVWLLMCATETVCLLAFLSLVDFPNIL
jgi:hypothetical protein